MERDDGIAIVVLTHNRAHLVSKCVNVLLTTSDATREIVIWDNASTDATPDYLASIKDPRVRVIRSEQNVGQNGYARAFRETSAPYLVELDDDVIEAPAGWDKLMVNAYKALPDVGFLAADLEDDPNDEASNVRHHVRPHEYTPTVEHGVNLLRGAAGGGCAITSRERNERVGGFQENPKEVFWLEDAAYIKQIERDRLHVRGAGRPARAPHRRPLLLLDPQGEGGVLAQVLGQEAPPDGGQEGSRPSAWRPSAERPIRVVRRTVLRCNLYGRLGPEGQAARTLTPTRSRTSSPRKDITCAS